MSGALASEFILPPDAAVDELAQQLADRLGGEAGSARDDERTIVDTFDWRLFRAGLACETSVDRVVVRTWGDATPLVTAPVGLQPPLHAADLPDGVGFDRARSAAGIHALVPLASVHVHAMPIAVRNADGKVVARLVLERFDVGGYGSGTKLPARIRVSGVRGYEKRAAQVTDVLSGEFAFVAATDDVVSDVAAAVGRRPGDITSKIAVEVRADEPAAAAFIRGLADFAAAIERNCQGVVDDLDREFLHDLRVAVRRSRSLLRHAHDVLPEEMRACFQPELSWLQQATGDARDFDVWLASLSDVDPLWPFVATQRARAHDEVVAALQSERFDAFIADWRSTLHGLGDDLNDEVAGRGDGDAGEWGPWPDDAQLPVRDVATARIERQYRRLMQSGSRLTPRSPAPDVHLVRKRAKEIRYLLELFGPVFVRDRLDPIVQRLRSLQDTLGEFQDAEVQRSWLTRVATMPGAEQAQRRLIAQEKVARVEVLDTLAEFERATKGKRLGRALDVDRAFPEP